jgi:hypothetical protein
LPSKKIIYFIFKKKLTLISNDENVIAFVPSQTVVNEKESLKII